MSLLQKIDALNIASKLDIKDSAGFVLKNANKYTPALLKAIAAQIDFNQTILKKIPCWAENQKLLAHEGINLEQSSSESAASFKASLIHGEIGVDLTGGLGVDSYFLSKRFKSFIYNDPNKALTETVAYNFNQLGVTNCKFSTETAEEFSLEKRFFNWIYLDPSRRNVKTQKVFLLEECIPNLLILQDKLLQHTDGIMVKFSPMLDIKQAISKLKNITEVYIVADKSEVKELLIIMKKAFTSPIEIRCVNLNTKQPEFKFTFEEEKSIDSGFSHPLTYLYEPNAAIMKAGGFNSITQQFNLKKIAANSHLYTSESLIQGFPGRTLEILAVTKYEKGSLNKIVHDGKANVICRNFPLKPEEIKKKLGWIDGGDFFVYFTEDFTRKKIVIITRKV